MRDPAVARLEALTRDLAGFEHEFAQAERDGFEFVAEAAAREIERLQRRIRRHCEATGLALPSSVPSDER